MLTSTSLLVEEDGLMLLEHGFSDDRIHRILFDRVSSVLVWRTFPLGRFMLVLLLLGGTGGLLYNTREIVLEGIGLALVVLCIVALGRYAYAGLTHVRIVRGDAQVEYRVIASRGKVRRFVSKLTTAIDARQAELAARREAEPAPADEAEAPAEPTGQDAP